MSIEVANVSKNATPNVLASFERDLRLRDISNHTIECYLSNLRTFQRFIVRKNVNFSQVNRDVLLDFITYLREEKQVKGKTVHYYFTALNALYKYLLWERMIQYNPVPEVSERYVRKYKKHDPPATRQLISIEQMAGFVHSIFNTRDRAVITLLAKTGIRRDELVTLDIDDIDRGNLTIRLKNHRKRTNHQVFFDDEANRVLGEWLEERLMAGLDPTSGPLFINQMKTRLKRQGMYTIVTKWAKIAGIHKPTPSKIEERFTPHCCRHWFTTHLNRAGMKREYIAWLRGDADKEAQDIYNHIDPLKVRDEYLKRIPQLGL